MTEFELKPRFLENKIQHYAWGAKNEQAYIPQLLGEKIETEKPYAELWIGAHPKAPSLIIDSDKEIPLNELIARYPNEILGESTVRLYNNKLPFLFKVLSAGEALSIQAHPNKAQAEELHRIDPVNYPDDNHKPEIAIAIDAFTALVGFRSYTEILSVLKNYPEIVRFVGADVANVFLNSNADNPAQIKTNIKQLYTELLIKATKNPESLEQSLNELERRLVKSENKLDEREHYFLELKQQYQIDVGLYSLFLLNLVHLNKGESVFLDAGIPHAYLKGNIIECMANSDNVVRAGLTPKFKDANTLVKILTFESGDVNIFKPNQNEQLCRYPSATHEFSVSRINLKMNSRLKQSCQSIQIIFNLSGSAEIQWADGKMECIRGNVIMIPAALEHYTIIAKSDTELYLTEVPTV